jgi:D-serine deaminase-like pyridoxal phosphate-dependent protein
MTHDRGYGAAVPGEPVPGTPISEVETPAALLDLDLFEANASRIHQVLAVHGRQWRPHSKAHKSPVIARRQMEIGAVGITCAKVSEAEVMAAGGIPDILIANELASPEKWYRLALLQRTARVVACVDDEAHVAWAGAAAGACGTTVPLLIEVDVGMNRTGVTSVADALGLASLIEHTPGTELAGVMGYEGHLLNVWPMPEKLARCAESLGALTSTADALRAAGHRVEVVSSGGTGTFEATAGLAGLTESQAGGGCLMDRFYAEQCHVDLAPALTLATTVTSVRARGGAVVDAGFKALGRLAGFELPRVLRRPGVEFVGLSAEHGLLALDGATLQVGDPLAVIPAYSDAMLFLHRQIVGHRAGIVTEVIPMPGRGMVA